MNDLKELHKRYDYYYDKEKMENKLGTRWFDLEELDKEDDIVFSTDFTDEADDLNYKRYKVNLAEAKETIEEYQELIDTLQREAEEWWPHMDQDEQSINE